MMRPGSVHRGVEKSRGFTLLELLLAISIFAVVVAVLFSSFWVGIGAWEKGEAGIEFQQRMRAVSELMFREISSTYPYFLTPSQLDKHISYVAFFGEPNSLRFVSYANLHKRASGLCMLEFWVSERRGLLLGEAAALCANKEDFDAVPLRSAENALEICSDVKGLQFRYFEQKNEDEPGEWLERWDPVEQQGVMPKIIEVTLTFLDQRDETVTQQLIIPIMSSLQK
jgi:general secretion pathway protein J